MSFGWKKITANVWRLDDTWQVVQETPGQWRVYRGDQSTGFVFATVAAPVVKVKRRKVA